MNRERAAEEILDKLFTVMEDLTREMRSNDKRSSDHYQVFGIFAELGRTMVNADRASFWRWDKRGHQLVTTAATGTGQITIPDTAGIVGQALALNRPLVTNDPYHHPKFNSAVDKATGYLTRSILVLPVSNCRGEVIGAFQVINKRLDEENFDETGFDEIADVKRLSIAAFICGLALESDLFMADAQNDKLTGLKNRFGFYSDWQSKYLPLTSGEDNSLAIILCDIDFFKKVNDTYGHNAGDAVLKKVAQVLQAELPTGSNAYRWGGEEFIIVHVGSGLAATVALAEQIRSRVAESECHFEEQRLKVTMSFGCSAYERLYTLDENIGVADERLYHAKEQGRNRVVGEAETTYME
ncbi:MAG: sensor domain-containing diguanylate cyclase [Selenomonadaceae bacterium]|nr:sensor domain-containing diguanylate cyclase [Selenomonadaceae bacterium]